MRRDVLILRPEADIRMMSYLSFCSHQSGGKRQTVHLVLYKSTECFKTRITRELSFKIMTSYDTASAPKHEDNLLSSKSHSLLTHTVCKDGRQRCSLRCSDLPCIRVHSFQFNPQATNVIYIYGAPSKVRNANVVYIWTYVWQR